MCGEPGYGVLVASDKGVDFFFSFCRGLPDFDADQKRLNGKRNFPDYIWKQHDSGEERNQQRIQEESQKIQRKISLQAGAQERISEKKHPEPNDHQHQLVYDCYRHKYDGTVGSFVSVFLQVIKLHGLPAGGGRGDAGVKEPDEGIADALEKAARSLHGMQEIPDHASFGAYEEERQKECGNQGG